MESNFNNVFDFFSRKEMTISTPTIKIKKKKKEKYEISTEDPTKLKQGKRLINIMNFLKQ